MTKDTIQAAELFVPTTDRVKHADYTGEYAFAHDGWPGILTLHAPGGRSVRGSYRDDRFSQTFVVTGEIDPIVRHRLVFVIWNFNWLVEQHFVGYLFTRGRQVIAGTTHWRDEPFGFVARKGIFLAPRTHRTGSVEPADFAGEYEFHHDGQFAVIKLEYQAERRLTGSYHQKLLNRHLAVEAEVDQLTPHAISLWFTGDMRLAAIRLTGYLFTRPKNVVAGVINSSAGPSGFYMARRG